MSCCKWLEIDDESLYNVWSKDFTIDTFSVNTTFIKYEIFTNP